MASYDMIVIGGGPGGYVAAIRAAQLGQKTAVVERDKAGGRCLNYACIPAKTVLHTAQVYAEVAESGADLGVKATGVAIDWKAVQERRAKVSKTLEDGVSMLWKKNKVEFLTGEGSLAGDGKVKVGRRHARGEGDRPGDRLGGDADPRHRLLGARDRHLGRVVAGEDAEGAGGGRRRGLGV